MEKRMRMALEKRKERGMLRSLDAPLALKSSSDNLVDFSSNDYLSLASSPFMRQRLLQLMQQQELDVFGPSSSRLLDGNTSLHRQLETRLTDFFCGSSSLLFNSGFDANVGIWSTIPGPDDWIVYDEFVHASTHDGMRASRTKKERRVSFKHNDVADLDLVIQRCIESDSKLLAKKNSLFVSVESLYSMDGDLCPLVEVVQRLERYFPGRNGHLIVDEAHSTGLYGSNGRGLTCEYGLANRVFIRLHTFGKAAACSGAVVICFPLVRQYLINYARPLIFSSVMPRINVLAISAAIDEFESDRRTRASEHLEHLSNQLLDLLRASPHMSTGLAHLPFDLVRRPDGSLTATSPIIPIITHKPRDLAAHLVKSGFLVRPITSPTVPKGLERVRICLHAGNTEEQIHGVTKAIEEWIQIKNAPVARL